MRHCFQKKPKYHHHLRPVIAIGLTMVLAACSGGGGGGASATATPASATPDPGTPVNVQYPASASLDSFQYQIQNASSGKVLGINGQSQSAGAGVVQETNTGSADTLWHFMQQIDSGGDYRANIENLLTHQVLAMSAAATVSGAPAAAAALSGAQAVQYANTGNDDQNWVLYLLKDGNYLLKNHNSNLYLQYDAGTDTIDQAARATSGSGCTCQEWTLTATAAAPYSAPMAVQGSGIEVHDPNMLQDANHVYWLYGTHQTVASSTDLVTWTAYKGCAAGAMGGYAPNCPIIGPDLPSWTGLQTPLSWNNGANTDVWAPDVMLANGTYYQYYSIPVAPDPASGCAVSACQGGEAIIGLATSTSPSGPWTDKGWITRSWSNTSTPIAGFGFLNTTRDNAIDPAPFIDAQGNWWLVYGSWFDGTHMIQLDPASGLPLTANPTIYNIAHRWFGEEGPFVYPYVFNGTQYYYYFAPINACCSATSPYRIIYGRSTSPTGPYYDRGGLPLYDANGGGGGTILLSAHGKYVGPGGQSVFTDTGPNGTESLPTLVYHYYDGDANGTPKLGLNRIAFTADGWPYLP